ncbi:hypothetical protein ACSQ67_004318 [Phaseolus vulgaris]
MMINEASSPLVDEHVVKKHDVDLTVAIHTFVMNWPRIPMAYRRCLLIRGNLVDRRCHPSFSYVLHNDEGRQEKSEEKSSSAGIFSPCTGYGFCRYMSTVNQGSDKIDSDIITDVADVLTDTTIDTIASQAPIINEVAIAAADSFLLVKGLQYVIDAVHSYTGLNWWAAIVLTTLLIRSATVPLLINQLKATSKLTLMRPHLEEIKQQMDGMVISKYFLLLMKLPCYSIEYASELMGPHMFFFPFFP